MARHDLKVLPGWSECERCDRHESRLGVVARVIPAGARVVVLATAASRAGQAAGRFSPAHLRLVEYLRARLSLADDECIPDVLVACGLGEVLADEVAACSSRFDTVAPQVIVFANEQAARLASRAGLVSAGAGARGRGTGSGPAVPALTLKDDVDILVAEVGKVLQRKPTSGAEPSRAQLVTMADKLLDVLGDHRGVGSKAADASSWKRTRGKALSLADLKAHLAGTRHVAPFHPQGDWRFVVIDVDRHNALQEKHFEATCLGIKKLFPHAFAVTSSDSLGRHYYVRLPPAVEYDQGALVVGARLALEGLRWVDESGVRAQRVEVPEQPVRLPFGLGSSVPSSKARLDTQLHHFVQWVTRSRASDYNSAVAVVAANLKLRGPWSPEHRNKVRRYLLDEEVGGVAPATLTPEDPWLRIMKLLPSALRVIASSGVPAFGTRTRWTVALVAALSSLVEPAEAETLMLYWLRGRTHASEDITMNREVAEQQTQRIIRDHYKGKGVPLRFWTKVEQSLDSFFLARRKKNMFWWTLKHRLKDDAEKIPSGIRSTAFFILKRFYDGGKFERRINSREFARFVGKNLGRATERLLAEGTWLVFAGAYVPNETSRLYQLHPDLWPPRPNEPRIHVPPR